MGKNNMKQVIEKRRNNQKKIVAILIMMLIIGGVVFAVYKTNSPDTTNIDVKDYIQITFTDFYEKTANVKEVSKTLKMLDGKKVSMKGYMAEQSPLDKSFIYLVNQPYVVCPFCTVGDTTKLDVISIYRKNGGEIEFKNDPVEIYGTLEVGVAVDEFGYTTQFRIRADKISTLQEGESDKKVNEYYKQLNDEGMIIDIQMLQMYIDNITNKEMMITSFGTSPEEIIDGIKAAKLFGEGQEGGGFNNYIKYIKECPEIIISLDPVDEKLSKINQDLIDLYNKNIVFLEKIAVVYNDIMEKEMTSEEKVEAYEKLISFYNENMELFDAFNEWNNELRK